MLADNRLIFWDAHHDPAHTSCLSFRDLSLWYPEWVEHCFGTASRKTPGAWSGSQMQRLCIARALYHKLDIILMKQPCSTLDPSATQLVEDLIGQLRTDHIIVIITHNMQEGGVGVSERRVLSFG